MMRWLVSARAMWIFATGVVLVSACATAVEDDEFIDDGTTGPITTSAMGGMDGTGGDGVTIGSTSSSTSSVSMGGMGGMSSTTTTAASTTTSTSATTTTSTTTSTTTGGGCNGTMCGSTCCVDPLNNPNFPVNLNPNLYKVCCPSSPVDSCGIELDNNPLNIPCQCTDGCN